MKGQTPDPIQVEDEILQVLFWMQGEGLGRDVPLARLTRFLAFSDEEVLRAAQSLISKGHLYAVSSQPDLIVRLSETGTEEGGRRFVDEFDPYLGHESHLVCDDPDCDCHAPDWDGACTHLGRVQ